MVFKSRRAVCLVRSLRREKCSKINYFPIYLDLGSPSVFRFRNSNPLESALVVASDFSIVLVLCWGADSQVVALIVQRISIYVIDIEFVAKAQPHNESMHGEVSLSGRRFRMAYCPYDIAVD